MVGASGACAFAEGVVAYLGLRLEGNLAVGDRRTLAWVHLVEAFLGVARLENLEVAHSGNLAGVVHSRNLAVVAHSGNPGAGAARFGNPGVAHSGNSEAGAARSGNPAAGAHFEAGVAHFGNPAGVGAAEAVPAESGQAVGAVERAQDCQQDLDRAARLEMGELQ